MSAYDPPDEILTIYNPINFFYDTGAGISQTFADLRYLKKSGDTATGLINFSNGILNSDGSNVSPAISFINDSNTGLYRIGADNFALTCGGSKIVDFATTLVKFSQPVRIPDGTVAALGLNFNSNPAVGLFNNTGALGLVVNGVNQLNLSTTAATFTNPIQTADGTASNCGYGFSSSASSGMYYTGGVLRHMLGNTEMMKFQAAQIYSSRNHNFVNGTAGNPSICAQAFQTTGFFWATGPILGVCTAGVQKFQYSTTQNISNQVLNMSNNNIINAPQIGNIAGNLELAMNATTGSLTLTGGGLISGTAGGSSGNHLILTINGSTFKVALLNP